MPLLALLDISIVISEPVDLVFFRMPSLLGYRPLSIFPFPPKLRIPPKLPICPLGTVGLEPTTPRLKGESSIQLSYIPMSYIPMTYVSVIYASVTDFLGSFSWFSLVSSFTGPAPNRTEFFCASNRRVDHIHYRPDNLIMVNTHSIFTESEGLEPSRVLPRLISIQLH
jgi:hypothetical protein